MKTNRLLLLCILCLCTYTLFATSPKREFRAVWLSTVGVDWPTNKVSSGTQEQITAQKNELIGYLDNLVANNINAICYHVRPMADRMYISTNPLLPWCHYLSGWTPAGKRGIDPGYDPLAFAIEEAHKRGIELHAWLNPFRYETSTTDRSYGSDDPIRKQHPEWILTYDNRNSDGSVNFNGTILDPGNPEVRAHIVDVVDEIITNYDVDGIIFDDYFYPYSGTNNNEDAISQTRKPAGMTLADWRRDNVNKTIEGVYNKIQEKEPWVRFGISPFGIYSTSNAAHTKYDVPYPADITGMDAYNQIYCDPLAWMQGGYIDYISPQLYWSISPAGQSYTTLAQWWSDRVKEFSDNQTEGKKVHFFSSQRTGLRNGTRQTNDELDKQVGLNRSTNKQSAPGAIFFSYKTTFDSQGVAAYLKTNKFTQQSLPPAMDWKATETLAAPTNVTLSGSKLSWSHGSAKRFTVYAYTKGTDNAAAMADPSNLVRVVYGKSLDVSSVSGYQNKTFAVCAYDRYGNEFAAGYYNLQVTEPTIKANPASFTLTGKHNQTAPYVDIEIEGLNLNADMSVDVSTEYVSVETLSAWNNRTGGTLRVSLSTSIVQTIEGQCITVQSGEISLQIPFTAIVQALQPAIRIEPAVVTLTGVQNSVATKNITVTAEDLSNDITITHSDLVSYTLTDWDARTGGTLTLILNTSKELGDYTGTLTLTSGTTSQTINIIASIIDGPKAGTVSISQVWKQANPSYIPTSGNNNRSMVYYDGKLYIADTGKTFHIINAVDASFIGTKDLGALLGSYHPFNLRITDDGQLLSGNSNTINSISVFAVDKVNGGSVEYATDIDIGRTDYFDVYGNWNESGYIIAYSNTGNAAYIPFENGVLQTAAVTTSAIGTGGTSARAYAYDESSFFVNASSHIPNKYTISSNGTIQASTESFGTTAPVSSMPSGMAIFSVAGHNYMITPASAQGAFDIFEITDGLNSAVRVIDATASLGSNANSSATVDFATHVDGNDAYIYVLAPNNGVAAYKFTFTPTVINPILIASNTEINLSGEQGAADAYQDVTITGTSLTSDIEIASSSDAFTFETLEGWNTRTGGTLRIKLNTSKDVDTYSGDITLTSGSANVTITVAGTIIAKPTITASTTSLSLSGEEDASGIYQDISITAANLTADMTITNEHAAVTYDLIDWNARTGGTLRITLDTSKDVDTYTGNIILTSGSARMTITITGTITAKPTITASATSITLSGEQEETGISQDVTITGVNLGSDITITNTNAAITIEELEDWNARTGGTLRIRLNTNKEIGTYEGNITLTSGSLSATIAVTATVEEMVEIDPTPLAGINGSVSINKIWSKSLGITINNRSMAYYNGKLYISNRNASDATQSGFIVVNAADGTGATTISTGITGFAMNNLRITSDGQMLFGNSGAGSGTSAAVSVYSSNITSGGNSLLKSTTLGSRTDFFYTYGSWQDGGYLLVLSNAGNKILKLPFSGGGVGTAEIIPHDALPAGDLQSAYAKAVPSLDGKAFYANTASNSVPTKHTLEGNNIGAQIEVFGDNTPVQSGVSGLGVFSVAGQTYMALPIDKYGKFGLWDITNGLGQATELKQLTTDFSTSNGGVNTIDFCTHVEGNDAYIYVLAPNNGVAAYKFTFTPKYDCVFTNESGDGKWGTASNWQDGKMPTLTDHVLVKAPCTVNVNNAVAKSINLLKGSGTLTVAAQAALTVDGTVRRVENETFPATRSYTSVSDILIEANANSTGIFAHKDAEGKTRATVQIYGDYTTENGYDNVKWQYVAMPSHQEHAITQFTGGWLLRFDEPNDDWAYLNDADPVELFQGYLLLQPSVRTYHFPSKLAPVTPQTITLSRKGATGENLLGNSWTAPLHINQFTESDFVNIDATIHLWDYQDGDDGSYGVYHEHPIKSSETVINPLQAFFIVTNVDGATIKLDPANLISSTGSHVTLNPYKAPQRATAMYEEMGIRVTGNDKYYCDVRLLQNEEYTAGFDNGYDGRKLEGDAPIPYLAGVSTDGDMAVLATPQYDGTFLNFRKGSNGEQYTFTFTYDGTTEYYLEDIHIGTQTAIRADETYTFTPSDDDSYRFRVVAAQKAPDQTTDVPTVWASDSKLYLTNPAGVETTVAVYSASGQLIQMSTTTDVLQPLESLTTGVYIIYVRSVFGTQMIKHIM